jgi:hypothetical protein
MGGRRLYGRSQVGLFFVLTRIEIVYTLNTRLWTSIYRSGKMRWKVR